MVDITHKHNSLRTAIATAVVKASQQETIQAIVEKKVPKGDVFEMAKTAGLFAVKRTFELIPDCHPLPVEYTAVRYRIEDLEIHIEIEVHTVYKTGVEVEAMHGASVVALTMYDMLKPIDKHIEIQNIRLLEKTGGKSSTKLFLPENFTSAVIVYSDAVKEGKKQDTAGQAVLAKLQKSGIGNPSYYVLEQTGGHLSEALREHVSQGTKLVIVVGGTGVEKSDNSPEIVRHLIDFEIPGIAEAMRTYGQERTSLAMLSRSVAGIKNKTLLMTLPGSTQGAKDSMDALFPSLMHIFRSLK